MHIYIYTYIWNTMGYLWNTMGCIYIYIHTYIYISIYSYGKLWKKHVASMEIHGCFFVNI